MVCRLLGTKPLSEPRWIWHKGPVIRRMYVSFLMLHVLLAWKYVDQTLEFPMIGDPLTLVWRMGPGFCCALFCWFFKESQTSLCDLFTYSPGKFHRRCKIAMGEYDKPEAFGPNCRVQNLNETQNLSVFRITCFEVINQLSQQLLIVGIFYNLTVVLKLIQLLLLCPKYRTLQFVIVLPKYAIKMCISSNLFGIVLIQ